MPAASRLARYLSRSTATIAIALGLGLSLAPLVGCDDPASHRLEDARRALEEDRHELAARIYREIASSEPSGPYAPKAELELARVQYLRLRDIRSAHDRLVRLLEAHPQSDVVRPARDLLARIYARELDDPERALSHYRVLAENETDIDRRRELLLAMADCYYTLDQLPESRVSYRDAIDLPYAAETDAAYLRLARLEFRLGDLDFALGLIAELEHFTTDDANRREGVLTAIELLINGGRIAEARERLASARAGFPPSEREVLDAIASKLEADTSLHPNGPALDSLQARIPWGGARRARARSRAAQER